MATSTADYEKILEFSNRIQWRGPVEAEPKKDRDRSLNGKARIRARRAARR